jgi:ribonuclease HII
MNFLAGVDEAGLGPVLGPLVVAGIAMAGPEGVDPWKLLQRHVSKRKQVARKVRVADSKKVNQGPHGLQRLEETALVFWTALHGELPADLGEWLGRLGVDVAPLRRCPWYADLALALPRAANADWVRLQAELVARALRQGGVSLLDVAVRPVDVEEWNGLIADTDNKSRAHFRAYAEVIGRVLQRVPARFEAGASGHLVADRCGGRMHYAADLRALCPDATVDVVLEETATSVYRLGTAAGTVTVTFAERGEDRAFPTALASCFAKYLRELMVEVMNRWFCARVPGLQPTAGYFVDGHRFLVELEPHLLRLELPRERLVRVR